MAQNTQEGGSTRNSKLGRNSFAWTAGVLFLAILADIGVSLWAISYGTPRLTLVAIVLIPAVVGGLFLVRRPLIAIGIVAIVAAVDQIVFTTGPVKLTISAVALVVFAPAFARVWLRKHIVPWWFFIGASLISLGLLVAIFVSLNSIYAIIGTVFWIGAFNYGFAIVTICARNKNAQIVFARLIAFSGIITGIFGVLQRLGIYILVGDPYASGTYNSTFGYYSNFASFSALAFIIGAGFYLYRVKFGLSRKDIFLMLFAVLISGFSAVASLSRGSLISMAVGVCLIILSQIRTRRGAIQACCLLAMISLIIIILIPSGVIGDLISRFVVSPSGDSVRSELQQGGWQLVLNNPLGIGYGNFENFVINGTVQSSTVLAHSHNTYIQMGLDAGWIGAIGFLLIVLMTFFYGYFRGTDASRIFAIALLGFLVQITQDYFFFEPASLIYFIIILSCAVSTGNKKNAHFSHKGEDDEYTVPPKDPSNDISLSPPSGRNRADLELAQQPIESVISLGAIGKAEGSRIQFSLAMRERLLALFGVVAGAGAYAHCWLRGSNTLFSQGKS